MSDFATLIIIEKALLSLKARLINDPDQITKLSRINDLIDEVKVHLINKSGMGD